MHRNRVYLALFLLFQVCFVYFFRSACCDPTTPTIYLSTGDRYADLEHRAHLIRTYYHKIMNSTGQERAKYEQLYFNVYPASYIQFYTMYSGDKSHRPFPASDEDMYPGNDWHWLFHHLESIDKEEYYNRMIDLDIGGWYAADQFCSNVERYLSTDTEFMVELLARRSYEEIRSVFRFMYDEPHPSHSDFVCLYEKVKAVNKDIANRLQSVYEIQSRRVH